MKNEETSKALKTIYKNALNDEVKSRALQSLFMQGGVEFFNGCISYGKEYSFEKISADLYIDDRFKSIARLDVRSAGGKLKNNGYGVGYFRGYKNKTTAIFRLAQSDEDKTMPILESILGS